MTRHTVLKLESFTFLLSTLRVEYAPLNNDIMALYYILYNIVGSFLQNLENLTESFDMKSLP